jgi:sugar O-acyltransferase (sialic acid O-acetyltransferase NeuD family)
MTRIVMVGAGGHARVLFNALSARRADILGFVSLDGRPATGVMSGLICLGNDDDLMERGPDGIVLVNGVGSTHDPTRRRAAFEVYCRSGFTFAAVVHPSAVVAPDAVLGEGAQVMAGAVLQPGVRIGANAIVNTGAIVDHDNVIGDHVHVAPGACLSGGVTVGAAAHIGAGATVIQGICVNAGAVVGAGAVVIRDVAAGAVVTGIPARARACG